MSLPIDDMSLKQLAAETISQALPDLGQLISVPSISTDNAYKADILQAAAVVEEILQKNGFRTKQLASAGNPAVYGEWLNNDAAMTVLFYGHYDVQPVDPLSEWLTEPFHLHISGDQAFGRGASDMKGQVIACIYAASAAIRSGKCPINIKFIIEGEEEIGSPHFGEILRHNQDLLSCDLVVNADAGMVKQGIPTIVYGLRGLVFFEIHLKGADYDLHSGAFGGIIHNPASALSKILAGLHDEHGNVTLPGFYSRVIELPPDERQKIALSSVSDEDYLRQTGAPELWGDPSYSPAERIGIRPTLDINGMYSGYQGQGGKTIIPAEAVAKISCRLVPEQDPALIHAAMVSYLEKHAPLTMRWTMNEFRGGGRAVVTNPNTPSAKQLAKAYEATWKHPVAYRREGGSINVVNQFKEILGRDSLLTGFGLPDDHIHSPNERLHLPTWRLGIEALLRFLLDNHRGSAS